MQRKIFSQMPELYLSADDPLAEEILPEVKTWSIEG